MRRRSLILAAVGSLMAPAAAIARAPGLKLSDLKRIVAGMRARQKELVEVIVTPIDQRPWIAVGLNGTVSIVPVGKPVYVRRELVGIMRLSGLEVKDFS